MIDVKNLKRTYTLGQVQVPALKGVSFKIKKGEFVGIMGPSGSGKSTMLHQLAMIDTPTSGKITVDGTDVTRLRNDHKTLFRLETIGLVFQFYSLLPELTALENVYVPGMLRGTPLPVLKKRAISLLTEFGLKERINHAPGHLSGGEQQRVAIARALINEPKILLADEPTANLDTTAALNVLNTLKRINKEEKLTVIVVTHEEYLGRRCRRIIKLKDGKLQRDQRKLR